MSFKTDNTYFIKLELASKVKGLSTEASSKYYSDNLKDKFRDKLRNSYFKTENRANFYNDAFEVLQEFEDDYLLLNLFFESDQESILNDLNKMYFQKSTLSVRYLKKYKNHIDEILSVRSYNKIDLEIFILQEFESITEISIKNLSIRNPNDSTLQRQFASWLVENINFQENVYLGLIFYAKVWEIYFSNPFDNIKAIILFDSLISNLKKIENNFAVVIEDVSIFVNSIFSIITTFPLIENNINIEGVKDIYKNKKEDFLALLNNNKIINLDFINVSYKDLYENYSNAEELNIKHKIVSWIKEKIDLNVMPTKEDFLYFGDNNENNDFVNEFNSSFYLYHNLPIFNRK